MKITLSTSQIADELRDDQYAGWSCNGAYALAEWLEELEEASGEDIELDVVAIRCDYTEYSSALEAATEFGFEPDSDMDDDVQEDAALEWLQDQTTVIPFEDKYGHGLGSGVIVQVF